MVLTFGAAGCLKNCEVGHVYGDWGVYFILSAAMISFLFGVQSCSNLTTFLLACSPILMKQLLLNFHIKANPRIYTSDPMACFITAHLETIANIK